MSPAPPARPGPVPAPSPLIALPRSSASNRIIGAKDHASIQMNVAEVSRAGGREAWVRRVAGPKARGWR